MVAKRHAGKRRAVLAICLAGPVMMTGCQEGVPTQATGIEPLTVTSGQIIVSGSASEVMNCAAWQGAGEDAAVFFNSAGGSIVGPDGWVATFQNVSAGQTRVILRDAAGQPDRELDRQMRGWLQGCPGSSQIILPGMEKHL